MTAARSSARLKELGPMRDFERDISFADFFGAMDGSAIKKISENIEKITYRRVA